jgi:hypothetical protein
MIMHLLSDTALASRRSLGWLAERAVDGRWSGLALGLVDELALGLRLVLRGRRDVLLVLAIGAARGRGPLDADDHVTHHLFGDVQGALDLRDDLGRRVEQDDVVRTFAIAVDGVREATAPPRADLDDLAARTGGGPGGAVDDRLRTVIGDIGPEDQHELITTHG